MLVKTTSFATVAAPKFIAGSRCCQSTLPVAASRAVKPPLPSLKFCLISEPEMPVALARTGKSFHGTNRRLPASAIGVSTPP